MEMKTIVTTSSLKLSVSRLSWILTIIFLQTTFLHANAYAYIGPGAGLSAIGTVLALLATILVAIFGFVWFPLKRLIRKRKQSDEAELGLPTAELEAEGEND